MKINTFLRLALILAGILFAGQTSEIVAGMRVYDLIVMGTLLVCLSIEKRVNRFSLFWCIFLLIPFSYAVVIGTFRDNPFVLGAAREWGILLVTLMFSAQIQRHLTGQDYRIVTNAGLYATIFVYAILALFPSLSSYYIDLSVIDQKSDYMTRTVGPIPILFSYTFCLLIFKGLIKNLDVLLYIFATLLVFYLSESRQVFVIMSGMPIAAAFARGKIGAGFLVSITFLMIAILVFGSDGQLINRGLSILQPGEDSAFLFRVVSGAAFLNYFSDLSLLDQVFGVGFGAVVSLYLGDFIGSFKFTLFDNSIFTLMHRVGIFGTLIFFSYFYFSASRLRLTDSLVPWFAIIVTSALSAHLVTVPLYILGHSILCEACRKSK